MFGPRNLHMLSLYLVFLRALRFTRVTRISCVTCDNRMTHVTNPTCVSCLTCMIIVTHKTCKTLTNRMICLILISQANMEKSWKQCKCCFQKMCSVHKYFPQYYGRVEKFHNLKTSARSNKNTITFEEKYASPRCAI